MKLSTPLLFNRYTPSTRLLIRNILNSITGLTDLYQDIHIIIADYAMTRSLIPMWHVTTTISSQMTLTSDAKTLCYCDNPSFSNSTLTCINLETGCERSWKCDKMASFMCCDPANESSIILVSTLQGPTGMSCIQFNTQTGKSIFLFSHPIHYYPWCITATLDHIFIALRYPLILEFDRKTKDIHGFTNFVIRNNLTHMFVIGKELYVSDKDNKNERFVGCMNIDSYVVKTLEHMSGFHLLSKCANNENFVIVSRGGRLEIYDLLERKAETLAIISCYNVVFNPVRNVLFILSVDNLLYALTDIF
jgi:hypothetical protein